VKTLLLGLGNPILADDGVGIRVARFVDANNDLGPDVEVAEASVGGLRLVEVVSGHENVVLVDAIQTVDGTPGDIYTLTLDAFCSTMHSSCTHDMDLFTAWRFGEELGLPMPKRFDIVAIEVLDVINFTEECTPDVEAAIPAAAERVLELLRPDTP
jgi:hydrogenase maturation protease